MEKKTEDMCSAFFRLTIEESSEEAPSFAQEPAGFVSSFRIRRRMEIENNSDAQNMSSSTVSNNRKKEIMGRILSDRTKIFATSYVSISDESNSQDVEVVDITVCKGAQSRLAKKVVDMPPFLKKVFDLVNSFKGGPSSRILSPRIAPVVPQIRPHKGVLSPSVFPFYNDEREEQILPIPKRPVHCEDDVRPGSDGV
uniref:Uncharacterized protein n=1 Tax=Angiostrongylus cantonensis TaxID=6313 RepID=A0A0K0D2U0_ANGCA